MQAVVVYEKVSQAYRQFNSIRLYIRVPRLSLTRLIDWQACMLRSAISLGMHVPVMTS